MIKELRRVNALLFLLGGKMALSDEKLWYPYTRMKNRKEFPKVNSADGVWLDINEGKKVIDGISSWWCMIHGYNNPELNSALIEQLNKMAHVMLGGLTHSPAEELAKKLSEITPGELNHVFFSDSGSVGVEVALKIAMQYHINSGNCKKTKIISLKSGYHGDTFKAMEISGETAYRTVFSKILPAGFTVTPPYGDTELDSAISEAKRVIEENRDEIAAFIVEPILQCAGGFKIYSAEYLNTVYKLCQMNNILFIVDEVATGFGRSGKLFASEYLEFTPDIMVLGKGLTAGYGGHAATIVTTRIFEKFYSESADSIFMHGPTFMGNPLICAVALKSIEIFNRENYLEKIKEIENILKNELLTIKSSFVKDIRVFGAMGVVELNSQEGINGFQEFAIENGVWLRPFDKYIYTMPPYIIEKEELLNICSVIKKWVEKNE